jgi:predicted small lipoprotein YifL
MALQPGGQKIVNIRRPARLVAGFACGLILLAGCGQKGPLYLPGEATEVVTRPTQTPPAPAAPDTPQTGDSPSEPPNPAPEVTGPRDDKDKKVPGASTPR